MEPNRATQDSQFATQCLLSSLKEVQDTIRSYDSKAQIVGVGFIFAIGIITNFGARVLPLPDAENTLLVVVFWIFAICPIIMFASVVYPSRRVAPGLATSVESVKRVCYYRPSPSASLSEYIDDLQSADWVAEVSYEIMRLSGLREIKRRRFLRALWVALMSFGMAAAYHIWRTTS